MLITTVAEQQEIERDVEGYLRRHEHKQLLRLVVIGSVDDGKSTLIGRLLHDTGGVYQDQLSAVRRASGKGATVAGDSVAEVDFSLLTDGLRAEREQGITIDVAYRYFATPRRKFIIADTPGHVQYTRNMATGASTADVAVILIDARLGVLAQTRRHAYLAALLGIPHLVVCVNKMDLIAWDAARYDVIAEEIAGFARRLGIADVTCLPISALRGDQVVARGGAAPWYVGPSLLDVLETVPVTADRGTAGLRFPVQAVIRPSLDYRGFAGQIASGVIRRGDEVIALPSGRRSRVAAIDTYDGELDEAAAPSSVTIRLTDEIDLGRGDMLIHADARPRTADRFDATLVWMTERPLDPARSYLLKHTSRLVRAEVEHVAGVVDPETLALRPAAALELNEIGQVTIRAHQPLFLDPYATCRATGAFILIDSLTNDTVAAGMIAAAHAVEAREDRPQVSPSERAARLGQRGAVVEVAGAGRAYLVERVVFDAGGVAAVVPAEAAAAVAAAGLIAVVVVERDELGVDDEAAARAIRDRVLAGA